MAQHELGGRGAPEVLAAIATIAVGAALYPLAKRSRR
jgi:hypothetical protein